MKFKKGDKVKFIGKIYNHAYFEDLRKVLDDNLGVLTISDFREDYYRIEEDKIDSGGFWGFEEWEFELVSEHKFTKANLQVGDICTLRNGEEAIIVKNAIITNKTTVNLKDYDNKLYNNFHSGFDIIKVERPTQYEKVYENKEILDDTEKKYLAGVIRPFRDKVLNISKRSIESGEFIRIELLREYVSLPLFEKGNMYIGMKIAKEYTLKELGL